MNKRDEDFKQLMDELKSDQPYVAKPDRINVDIGGACFLNSDRVCGADCTAYVSDDEPTASERCSILTSMNAGVALLNELVLLKKRDRPAPHVVPAPNPMGGRG